MAIPLKFYSIIIPAEKVKKLSPFGEYVEMLLEARKNGRILYDGELYCEQAMNPADNEMIIKFWEEKGLTPKEIINGKEQWKDLCIIEFPNEKPTLPCQWIKIFQQGNDLFAKMK
jgi:hypothetical protein